MAEIFDRQFDREKDHSEPWWLRATISAGIIGGMAFGITKMKGPFGQLVESVKKEQTFQEARKQIEKAQRDSFAFTQSEADSDSIAKSRFIDPINTTEDIDFPNVRTENYTINRIESIENAILKRGERITLLDKNAADFREAFEIVGKNDEYFAQLRHETLMEYLSKEPLLLKESGPDFSYDEIVRMDNSSSNKELGAVHEYYLRNSQKYADMYKRKVRKVSRSFWEAGARGDLNGNINNTSQLKDFIQNGKFDSSALAEAEVRAGVVIDQPTRVKKIYGGVVPDRQGRTGFDLIAEFEGKLLDKDERWLSRSHKFKETGVALFDQIGKFDYTGRFKRLASTLQRLRDDPTSPIKEATLKLEYRGDSQYAIMGITVEGHKRPYTVSIPISRDGLMPGKSRGASPRYDAFFVVGDEFGMTPEKAQVVNKSQYILDRIITLLDSSYSNRLADDPHGAIKQIRNMVMNEVTALPQMVGETRDINKLLAIHNDNLIRLTKSNPGKNIAFKQYMRDGVYSMNNIKRLVRAKRSGRNVMAIGFDLETIGFGNMGPSAQVLDPKTQVHTSNITTMDIGAKGNIVSDSVTMTSDHVIDYLNKNDGWTSGPESNTEWLRRLTNSKPSASDDEVRATFTRNLRAKAKGNSYRSKTNDEYLRKVARTMIDKVENAIAQGKEVFLVTKNGTQFDLHFLQIHAPNEYAKLMKLARHIDTHSVEYLRKESTYGQYSLKQNILLQKMLGEMGLDSRIDIDLEGGAYNFLKQVRGRKINGYTMLDFAADIEEKILDEFGQRAHESPGVDNITNFAMLAKRISEAEKGAAHFSTNHLSSLGRYVAMGEGPLSQSDDEAIFNVLKTQKTIFGRKFLPGAGLTTSNMLTKGILSLIDLHQMLPNPNVPGNKQWDQLFRGSYGISINRRYQNKLSAGGGGVIDAFNLKNPYLTDYHKMTEAFLSRAHDRTRSFAKQVTLKHFYISNMWAGREGMANISLDAAKQLNLDKTVSVAMDEVSFEGQAVLDNNLRRFNRRVHALANDMARKRTGQTNARPDFEELQEAGRILSSRTDHDLTIQPGSALAVSEGDFGVKVIKSEMGGKIVGVSVEQDTKDPHAAPIVKAQVEFMSTLDKVQNATYRSNMTKASLNVSDNMAYGAHIWATGDAIEKGYGGAAESAILMKAIDNLRRKAGDGGAEGRRAKEMLKDLATQLNASFAGDQMIKQTGADSVANFKHAKSATEKAEMVKLVGNSSMTFIDAMNWVKRSGDAWESPTQLARGYYQHWLGGWKGTAEKTITEGQKYLREILTAQLKKEFADIDDVNSEIGMFFKHFEKEDRPKIMREIRAIREGLLIPKIGGARIYEFRTPDGRLATDPNSKNKMLGMFTVDTGVISDVNEGKAIRHIDSKIRGPILQNLERSKTITGTTLDFLARNRRFQFNEEYASAAKKLRGFRDAFTARAMTDTRFHLSIEDIREMLNRTSTVALGDKPIRELTDASQEAIRLKLRSLMEFNDVPEEELESQINEMIESLTTRNMKNSLYKNTRWMSTAEIKTWEKMARKYAMNTSEDVFRVSTGLKEGLVIDFNKIQKMSGGKSPLKATDIEKTMAMFQNMLDESSKTGKKSIVKKVINGIDAKSGKWVQQVHLDHIILPALDRPGLIANTVTNSLGRATDNTQLSKEILSEVMKLDQAIKEGGDSASSKAVIGKKFVQLLLNGFDLHHTTLWGGANVAAPPSIMGPARGADLILMKAWEVRQNTKNLTKSQIGILDNILQSTPDTAFIARVHGESAPVRINRNGTWTDIKYGKYLEEVLGADMAEDILSGQKAAPGFQLRYPLEQQGRDAVIDKKITFLDDEMLGMLGIDKNGIWTLYHSEKQKVDYDADQVAIILKDLSVADKNLQGPEAYRHIMAEHKQQLQAIMREPDMRLKNTKRMLSGNGLGSFTMLSYDELGKPKTELVQYGSEAHRQFAEEMLASSKKLTRNIVGGMPEIITSSYVKSRVNMVTYNALMKTQIGVATNMIGRKMEHIAKAGRVLKPHVADFLLGNFSFGLPELNQRVMDFSKHGNEEFAAKLNKFMIDLGSPGRMNRDPELKHWIESGFRSVMDDHADELGMFEGRAPETYAREVTDALFNVELSRDIAVGGDRLKQAQLKAMDAVAIGQKGRSLVDDILASQSSFQNSINQSVYRSLMETGQYIDPSSLTMQKPLIQELGERVGKRFNISDASTAGMKKVGKFGAIGAGVFLALNLFRPNQLSNSMNPLDGFVDLGADVAGEHAMFNSSVQLSRRQPIDMVNASFSKEAFIRMQDKDRVADTKKRMSAAINDLLGLEYSEQYEYRTFRGSPIGSYSNYTTNIGYFGSANLERRSKL